ncbi:siderophore-interacting protein [Agromyces protaetiae]|uniref:Siderophore-interacting protein n=1 Tax=Agromyces protaetiae TaxID=2509455 RepID=A0A4P6F845_9MICO|nr:siderophore-interacting protein [Agromyces protaetiae]QAY71992.1 siderophore-interacting protein [Agromyces protaetiae]
MASSNIAISHADTGLVTAEVTRAEHISPHFVRLTIAGDELAEWRHVGFDQWFRLAVPTSDETRFDNLSDTFNTIAYLKYLTLPKATRPVIRNYTVREFRPEVRELDIDFVVHGDEGVAGPWAGTLPVGAHVGLIDQGRGFKDVAADRVLLVGDESALPAVAGILRDLPRDAVGDAIVELPDAADRQETGAPDGVEVHWVVREREAPVGVSALDRLAQLARPEASVVGFAAGESKLATGARRHLVNEWGVPKANVAFCGYWRAR